jgi:hypothetical protein
VGKLRRLLGGKDRPPGDLITATARPGKDGGWLVSWVSDGGQPPRTAAGSLTRAAGQAATAVAALYAGHPPVPGAELQLAIFPWEYQDGPIFDITGHPGAFSARGIQGSDRSVTGATLEDIVEAARRMPDSPESDPCSAGSATSARSRLTNRGRRS